MGVKRFGLDYHGLHGADAFIGEDDNGDYVRYSDYTTQAEEIARLREENAAKDERIAEWKAAAGNWRDAAAALRAKAREIAGKPGEALDEDELSTIEACVRNDQHRRILGLELTELVRSYRAARSLYLELGGEDV